MTSKLMGLHQHELVETAKLFSSKGRKLNVVFDDGGARTDGKTIWLPQTPPDVALSERGQRFDRAMVDHEASHHDVTNMKHFQECAAKGDKRLEGLVQGIEDCRVDKNAMLKHPGSRKNLGTARDISFEGSAEMIEQSKDARHFASTGIINAWWEKYGGWPSDNRRQAFEALPPKMQDFCRKYADLADGLSLKRTTKPTIELAEKALEELLAMGPMPPEPKDDEGQGQGQGQGQGEGQPQPQPQPQSGDNNEQEPVQGREHGGSEEEGQGNSPSPHNGEPEGQDGSASFDAGDEMASTNLADAHAQMMENEADTGRMNAPDYYGDARFPDAVVETNRLAVPGDWDRAKGRATAWALRRYADYRAGATTWEQRWSETQAAVRSTVAKVSAKLQEAFMASSQRHWSGGHDQGALDPKALVRAYQGRDGAFRRKDSGQDINAAVTLLLDCSGSMHSYGKEEVAGAMTVALAMALERMGVAVEVRGFTADRKRNAVDLVFKPFDMMVSQCRYGLGWLMRSANAENVDYLNVRTAAASLLQRREPKKMLIVLSDGQPSGFRSELEVFCKALHKRSELELLGVGIQSSKVDRYYPNHVVVNELSELSTVVAERIARTLLGRGLNAVKEAA